MDKYECVLCGYVYDPEVGDAELGIEPGVAFEELPDDFLEGQMEFSDTLN